MAKKKPTSKDYGEAAKESLKLAEAMTGHRAMTGREFLESMAKSDELLDHDGETCGMCRHRKIDAEVAREMLLLSMGKDEIEDAIAKWSAESQRRWRETKFFKLWQEERAAGRNPEKAFEARGWEA